MNPETHSCGTCGFTWMHGQSGSHSCAPRLIQKNLVLQQEISNLRAFVAGAAGFTVLKRYDELKAEIADLRSSGL